MELIRDASRSRPLGILKLGHAEETAPLPRRAEVDMATTAITAPIIKLKFIAWTKTGGFAGVGVAPGLPL
jgi:hypothetical protein